MDVSKKAEFFSPLKDYGFSDEGQGFWWTRVNAATEESQPAIIALLTTFSHEAAWLRSIQEQKEQALTTGDRGAWNRIISEEADHIASWVSLSQESLAS